MREKLKEIIEQLLAVESLEYHDKNLLSGDNKTRCEWKQKQFRQALMILEKYQLDTAVTGTMAFKDPNGPTTATQLGRAPFTLTQ